MVSYKGWFVSDDETLYAWREEVRKVYMDERRDANDKYFQQASHLSKLLITISAGTLAFSLSYIDKLREVKDLHLLKIAGICLISTIVLGIVSASFSFMALQKNRDLINEYYQKLLAGDPKSASNENFGSNIWNMLLPLPNVLVFLSFITSFILIALFTGSNL